VGRGRGMGKGRDGEKGFGRKPGGKRRGDG
jgi:hypothetical protein